MTEIQTVVVPVTLSESTQTFPVTLESNEYQISLGTAVQIVQTNRYEGEYEVIPKFELQTLPTRNKTLSDNVTVQAIEVSRVSNPSGGKTVYIGGIING